MSTPPYTDETISWHGAKAADVVAEIRHKDAEAQVVKQNSRRTIYRVVTPARRVYFVKHDHPGSLRNRVKSLWRNKCRQEFESAARLKKAGVPVAEYCVWGARGADSFLVSREVADARKFDEVWREVAASPRGRQQFIRDAGGFVKQLLAARVDHHDFHGGNILVREEDGGYRFFLIDTYGVRIADTCSPALQAKILSLFARLRFLLTAREGVQLLRGCGLQGTDDALQAVWFSIGRGYNQFCYQKWPGYRRRLLKSSSLAEEHRTEAGRWLLRRPFTLARAEQAFEQHEQNFRSGANVVKQDRKRQLSRVSVDGATYVVKEFRRPGARGRFRADCRSWLNSYRLFMADIPACTCHAWLKAKDGRGFLVLEDVGGSTLLERLKGETDVAVRHRLLEAAGRLAARVHACAVSHGDLNSVNYMVIRADKDGAALKLVDSDSVSTYRHAVPLDKRLRNLRQTLDLMPSATRRSERFRLLAAYHRLSTLDRATMKSVVHWLDDQELL